jgi:hypothetical protein
LSPATQHIHLQLTEIQQIRCQPGKEARSIAGFFFWPNETADIWRRLLRFVFAYQANEKIKLFYIRKFE